MDSNRLTRRELLKDMMLAAGASALIAESALSAPAKRADSRDAKQAHEDLVGLVNPMQGTNSNFGFSRGNTLPLVALPFGVTHWSAQTNEGDGWFFDPNVHTLQGVRATHQPSPWMGDYGYFTVMAQAGDAVLAPKARAAAYEPGDFQIGPHTLSVTFKQDGIRIEMTPTERCAAFRFTFPSGKTGRVLIDAHSHVEVDAGAGVVTGCSRLKGFGAPGNFGCYFYARFDTPIAKVYPFDDARQPIAGNMADGKDVGAAIEFEGKTTVVMRVATSFISVEQARISLDREIGSLSFDAVREAAAKTWNDTLGVARVSGGSERDRRTFYSCLYRAHLFPRMFHEYDASGKTVHYSAFDGKLHDGVMYTDTGLWDGYHTVYPLLSLLQPARLGEIIQGFIHAYQEGGWLPQWPNPGYHGTMGGTHSDVVIADAILKNIPGFDRDAAYAAIRKNATVDPGVSTEGRHHLNDYLRLGYVPGAVSDSLDYAYDDACIALAAQALGKTEDAALFGQRALNYKNNYDPAVGFMRAHNADGSWRPNFDQYAWGDGYTEGGPWQWTFAVPHDPAGLMALMGGRDAFLRKLDRMFWQPPTFHPGSYGQTIHEMREMASVSFGQYAQSNQPVHQVLPLYAAVGAPDKMHYWSRRVMDELYSPDNFPADEDNGEMASWFVLMALGLFPGCPGRPAFTLGSPLFTDITLTPSGGKTLHLHAPANSPKNIYVTHITRNGRNYSKLWIAYSDLQQGGRLDFTMAPRPTPRALSVSDLPESQSPYDANAARETSVSVKVAINCSGDELGEFIADCYFDGGAAITLPEADASPSGRSARQGAFTYKIPLPMPSAGQGYTIQLTFPIGGRQSVAINGKTFFPDLNLETSGSKETVKDIRGILPNPNGNIEIAIRPTFGSTIGGRLRAIVISS
ncbi:alpha-1 2-mannosidase [Capsulimonas corticalis]|uniref:Alpha-1 2-mannosidase n=1 Tax=Capsulimonas corticalis TaxID=2219043 RepID=A0A402CUV5_9BACT|nr:GH92 family glycosyl hydrolase [Capsulimonas corticalis]BDI29097.1 alpha-1 2-mannosidase [Capsulimonas corticalis]